MNKTKTPHFYLNKLTTSPSGNSHHSPGPRRRCYTYIEHACLACPTRLAVVSSRTDLLAPMPITSNYWKLWKGHKACSYLLFYTSACKVPHPHSQMQLPPQPQWRWNGNLPNTSSSSLWTFFCTSGLRASKYKAQFIAAAVVSWP